MSESQTEDAKAAETPKKKGRSKLLTLVLPIIVLLIGGGAGGWWYMRNQPAEAAAAEAKPVEPEGLVSFDAFVVNLADPGGRRFLRASLLLLVQSTEDAAKVSDNELTKSRVRSALIDLLGTRTAAQMVSPQGRADLKKEIAETAKATAHVEVKDVLFKEFVVQ
jgi:flagellar FliL protein